MKIQLENQRDGAWRDWFAWHPVETDDGLFLWLETARRRWDASRNFRCITSYDPGDFDGGWEYAEIAP